MTTNFIILHKLHHCIRRPGLKAAAITGLLVLLQVAVFGQQKYQQTDKIFLECLQKNDTVRAQLTLSVNLKKQLGPNGLTKLFDQLSGQVGRVVSYDTSAVVVQPDILQFIVNFQTTTLLMQFANSSAGIEGFYLLPPSMAYALPTYANDANYHMDNIKLASNDLVLPAVFTIPNHLEKSAVVVLFVGGSGPSDFDETIGTIKPFKDLAIGLANCGVGSLRFDKRSKAFPGKFKKNYSLNDEYLEDVKAAVNYIRTRAETANSSIVIVGHSLGGMLVPLLVKENPAVKGGIMLEANAQPVHHLILKQTEYLSKLNGESRDSSVAEMARAVKSIDQLTNADSSATFLGVKGSYWLALKKYNAFETIHELSNKNFLIVQGGGDYQVDVSNYQLWQSKLHQQKNVKFLFFDKLNHALINSAKTMVPAEYYHSANVPPELIDAICKWIQVNIKNEN